MLFAEISSFEQVLALLGSYRTLAYPILFLGAFLETLIPFSLVIYGEFFFIAGAVLAGVGELDILLVAAVLYSGGILGDNCSYWLGRKYGRNLFTRLSGWPVSARYFHGGMEEKGIAFFQRRGDGAVFFARLCGPFSWFVPALAGSFKQRHGRVLLFNSLGVIIGIGEFLAVGYLLGNNLDRIFSWLTRLGYIPIAAIATIVVLTFLSGCLGRAQGKN